MLGVGLAGGAGGQSAADGSVQRPRSGAVEVPRLSLQLVGCGGLWHAHQTRRLVGRPDQGEERGRPWDKGGLGGQGEISDVDFKLKYILSIYMYMYMYNCKRHDAQPQVTVHAHPCRQKGEKISHKAVYMYCCH